ncbi:MAG TPA: YlcI/YnfO family protein [Gemmatimonadales bacterium]|nr:YlcI/YnfO family protein [Gemmatimonadales bacterium]
MRTTIRLDDALLRRAKAQAAASGRSLNDFIADAVRASLAPRPSKPASVELPTYRGRGVQPGVDLDDTSALLDRMESPHGESQAGPARVAERPKPRRR